MRHSPFNERLQPCSNRLLGYALALTKDRDGAADLFQDCIVRAMQSANQPSDDRAFRAWLFRIMRNLWIDQLRAKARPVELEPDDTAGGFHQMPMSLEGVVVNRLAVRNAFMALSQTHRDVLALVDIAGFSYEETAELVGVPRGTVMSRVSRGRQSLARLLTDSQIASFPPRTRGARDD